MTVAAASGSSPAPGADGGDHPVPGRGTVPGARRALLLLALFSIVSFGDKAVLGLAGPHMIEDLGLTNAQFGLIGSSFYLLFSVSAFVMGFVGQRWPATWLLAGMAVVWSLAQLPILFPAAGLGVLIATRVLLGAGEGPGLPMANHVAFTWFRPEHRTTASGAISVGGALGVIIGGPVLALVIAGPGWRWAFGLLGLVGLVWAAVWVTVGGDGPFAVDDDRPTSLGEAPLTDPRPRTGPPLRRIARRPTFLLCVLAGFAAQWTLGVATSWLPSFLEDEAGYPTAAVGFLVGVPSLVAIGAVLGVVAGQRRSPAPGMVAPGHVPAARRARVAAAGPAADRPLHRRRRGPAAGLHGGRVRLRVAIAPLVAATLADLVPVARRGLTLCVAVAVTSLGAVASPWVTGRLLDLAATESAGFDWAFRINGALVLLGGLGYLLVDPDRDAARLRETMGCGGRWGRMSRR